MDPWVPPGITQLHLLMRGPLGAEGAPAPAPLELHKYCNFTVPLGQVQVEVRFGTHPPICMYFVGNVKDEGIGAKPVGSFRAQDAPAPPECPLP